MLGFLLSWLKKVWKWLQQGKLLRHIPNLILWADSDELAAKQVLEALYETDAATLLVRKDASVAKWDSETGMAQVIVRKGKLWNTTGIMRKDLLCHVEETVFLVEHGCLVLMHGDTPMQLQHVYELLSIGKYGCSWDAYRVYSYLKGLGYIIGRHGVFWSNKQVDKLKKDVTELDESESATTPSSDSQNLRLMFDVYPPNSQFKKTAPGAPSFNICMASGRPPTRKQVRSLQEKNGGIPVKFATVDGVHVGVFSLDAVELPCLP